MLADKEHCYAAWENQDISTECATVQKLDCDRTARWIWLDISAREELRIGTHNEHGSGGDRRAIEGQNLAKKDTLRPMNSLDASLSIDSACLAKTSHQVHELSGVTEVYVINIIICFAKTGKEIL